MSYYSAICDTCPDKHWIAPGTESSAVPRHEGSGYEFDGSQQANAAALDADHTPVPVDVHDVRAQQRMLARALEIIRERVPGAAFVDLETTDQDSYGFVLTGVTDEVGRNLLPAWDDNAHPLAGLADDVWNELSDLGWDGVVGEGPSGYVTIPL